MSTETKDKMSWLRAAGIGLVAGVLLVLLMGIFVGIIGALVVAFALRTLMGGTSEQAQVAAPTPAAEKPADIIEATVVDVTEPEAAPEAAPEPEPAPEAPMAEAEEPVAEVEEPPVVAAEPEAEPAVAEAPADAPLVKPSTALAGEAELAARKGSWRYDPQGGA